MRARAAILAALLVAGCSCGGGTRGQSDASAARDVGPQYDARPRENGPPSDGPWAHPGHPEEDWALALEVPWNPDGTRQLTPIEVPPAVAAVDCGSGCAQVTFLPGFRACTPGESYDVDGDYLATGMHFPVWHDSDGNLVNRCIAAYVDLRSGKAHAFGSIMPGPGGNGCGGGTVSQGRIAYSCLAYRESGEARAELRVYDIASATERLLWSAVDGATEYPDSLAFAGPSLAELTGPGGCAQCTAVMLVPLAGGSRQQIYPINDSLQGVLGVVAAYPYVVFWDFWHFLGQGLGAEVVAIDLRQPEQVINVSNYRADQFKPRISGTRVVWMDARNDPNGDFVESKNTDIYAKDLASGQEWAVCTDPARQLSPDIEGDIVVWLDDRNVPPDIRGSSDPYLLNLQGGTEQRLQFSPYLGRDHLRINGSRVFVRAGNTSLDEIFMIDLKQLGLVP